MNTSIKTNVTSEMIFKALESISQKQVICFHDESKGYAFKYNCGKWAFARYDFVHDIAESYRPLRLPSSKIY